ncbi:hypothetical protein AVEN_153028-1 [Araneus ventricosus]|uniref:Uncharacterized protein n=1 Tax=Araneus ventricosus TaxID=182803 RepID=A0A4Y2NB24_ARAVE|nr:hypothetical protein AVEN_153028-1 [Araneus ventricosus]
MELQPGAEISPSDLRISSSIQRPILLNITGADRTISTAALQVIGGLMPLHLKIKLESEYVRIARNIVVGGMTFQPCDYEDTVHGWQNHTTECIKEGRISSEEDLENKGLINIFTVGSKSELGVGTTFCILTSNRNSTTPGKQGIWKKIECTRQRLHPSMKQSNAW